MAHLPTPLEPLEGPARSSPDLRLFVKRDDCTGLALGGNKTRKLEYTIGDALSAGATTLITSGAWQSNHVRQTAAAAARVGLNCHAVVNNVVGRDSLAYSTSGNLLLDGLFGARLHHVEDEDEATDRMVRVLVDECRLRGETPYVVPLGASDGVGAIGYARCAAELLTQCAQQAINPSAVVLATGSGGTQAGLVAGFRLLGSGTRVIGISVSEPASAKHVKVRRVADEMLRLCGAAPEVVTDSDIIVIDDYTGPGYAIPTERSNAAVRLLAESAGLLIDPVYTAKAVAGLLDLIERGALSGDIIFLHTGGTPALFAYAEEFALQKKLEVLAS